MAARIRALLDDWFGAFPGDAKAELRQRFASNREDQHLGALVELFVSAFFQRAGYHIEAHPDVPGTAHHPDFLAQEETSHFYAECSTANPSHDIAGADRRRSELIDALDEVENDKWGAIFISETTGRHAPSKQRFKADVRRWLAALPSPEEARSDELGESYPEHTWRSDDWTVRLRAIPVRAGAPGGPVGGISMSEVADVDSGQRLRGTVEKKQRAYGEDLALPLLLAIVGGTWYANEGDLMTALVGDERWVSDAGGSDRRRTRVPNGAWTTPGGLKGHAVSAVLYAPRFSAWTLQDAEWRIVYHPSPTRPLKPSLLPLATEVTLDASLRVVEIPTSVTFRDFFELPNEWPSPDSSWPPGYRPRSGGAFVAAPVVAGTRSGRAVGVLLAGSGPSAYGHG